MKNKVIIGVSGGVAYLVEKPKGIEVAIRDYDWNNGNEAVDRSFTEDVYESNMEVKG